MTARFELGAVVTAQPDGPRMIVIQVFTRSDEVFCEWVVNGKRRRDIFLEDALTQVDAEKS